MTIATFTADAVYQDIFIQETDAIGNDDTNLSGFTLYAIPEPSIALLLTGAGLLIGFRRSRRWSLNTKATPSGALQGVRWGRILKSRCDVRANVA